MGGGQKRGEECLIDLVVYRIRFVGFQRVKTLSTKIVENLWITVLMNKVKRHSYIWFAPIAYFLIIYLLL